MAASVETVILDAEAADALSSVHHPKHLVALSFVEGLAQRRQRRPSIKVLVPVAVRVEAGWDRSSPAAAIVNRVSGARDVSLTGAAADRAAELRMALDVSVVDVTVAEAAESAAQPVVIVTSDVRDMTALAAHVKGDVRVVAI